MDLPERPPAPPAAHPRAADALHRTTTRSQLAELDVAVEAGRHVLDDVALVLRQARDSRHPLSLDRLPASRVAAALAALRDGLGQLDELLYGTDPARLGLAEALTFARTYVPRQWGEA